MNIKVWTKEFDDQATAEGWNVFTVDSGQHKGKLRIQRIDAMDTFKSDAEAVNFVRQQQFLFKSHALCAMLLHNRKASAE